MTDQGFDYTAALREADSDDRFDAELAARAIAAALEGGDHATLSAWFDATLAADSAEALARLEPAQIAAALPLTSRSRCATGAGCSAASSWWPACWG